MLLSVSHFRGESEKNLFSGRKYFCGASRKAGFGEGTPPCLVFPYIERTGQSLRPTVGGLFPFPLKIHFKGRQLPAEREIFSLLPTTDKNQKCQTPGQKNFSLTYYYNPNRSKWPGTEPLQGKLDKLLIH